MDRANPFSVAEQELEDLLRERPRTFEEICARLDRSVAKTKALIGSMNLEQRIHRHQANFHARAVLVLGPSPSPPDAAPECGGISSSIDEFLIFALRAGARPWVRRRIKSVKRERLSVSPPKRMTTVLCDGCGVEISCLSDSWVSWAFDRNGVFVDMLLLHSFGSRDPQPCGGMLELSRLGCQIRDHHGYAFLRPDRAESLRQLGRDNGCIDVANNILERLNSLRVNYSDKQMIKWDRSERL